MLRPIKEEYSFKVLDKFLYDLVVDLMKIKISFTKTRWKS